MFVTVYTRTQLLYFQYVSDRHIILDMYVNTLTYMHTYIETYIVNVCVVSFLVRLNVHDRAGSSSS